MSSGYATIMMFSGTINLVMAGVIFILLRAGRNAQRTWNVTEGNLRSDLKRARDLVTNALVTIEALQKQRTECRSLHGDGGIEHLPVATTRESMLAEVEASLRRTPNPKRLAADIDEVTQSLLRDMTKKEE